MTIYATENCPIITGIFRKVEEAFNAQQQAVEPFSLSICDRDDLQIGDDLDLEVSALLRKDALIF